MKKYQLFPFLGLLLFLASCSSTKDMQVLVTKPAIFEMPKNVKKILLVNRSKGNASSVIEGIFTGESPQQDKIQSEQCMAALQESLNLSKTVQVARHNTRLNADKGLSTGFGNPLDWSTVEDLAKEYNADAVLMLEFFDTDFFIRRVNRSDNQYVSVQGTASAVAGFRLYDPMNKTIMYEKKFSRSENYLEFSNNILLATAKLIKGSDALNAISYATGKDFGRRLVSYNTWEDRLMFKGKGETGKGARYVLANNWQKGVDVWQEAYKTEKSESKKGDLAYNIALGHEVLGNMQDAKKWITVSYVEHRNSKALRYSEIINTRIENEGILERQSKK